MDITPRSALLLALFGPAEPPPPPSPSSMPILLCGRPDYSPIYNTIVKRMNGVRYCYEQARRRDADLSGKLIVGFTIEDDEAHNVHVTHDALGDPLLTACVVEQFWLMRFPPARAGATFDITFPIYFRPLSSTTSR